MVTIQNVKMSIAAARNVEETSTDVLADVAALRAGKSAEDLLVECLSGADEDRREGWQEYVSAVSAVAKTRVTHHCDDCGAEVAESCADHPNASISSILAAPAERTTIVVRGAELPEFGGLFGSEVDLLVTSTSKGVAVLSVLARDVAFVESQLDADDAVESYETRAN